MAGRKSGLGKDWTHFLWIIYLMKKIVLLH